MKKVILIHGRPDKEEYFNDALPKPHKAHWFPWLKSELETRGIETSVPIMPKPYEPDYDAWKEVFEMYTLTPETVLVGHSRGGGFLLRYLSENPIPVAGFIMVAPSILPNPGVVTGFSEYEIDKNIINRIPNMVLFYSLDDEEGIIKSVQKIKEVLPTIHTIEYTDAGHFTTGDGYSTFPKLLEEILQ